MSNHAVGTVYQDIIEDVINNSRVDFEEGGVDETVLDTLRALWQSKLSSLNVASFPWEPKGEPLLAQLQAAEATLNASSTIRSTSTSTSLLQSGLSLPAIPTPKPSASNIQIKTEPGVSAQDGGIAVKQEPGLSLPTPRPSSVAIQRASQHMASQFGDRAMNSINAIQAGIGQASAAGPVGIQARSPTRAVFQPQPPLNTLPNSQSPVPSGQPPSLITAQTDGSGEANFEGLMIERDTANSLLAQGRVGIDGWLRDRLVANNQIMEGGGLMLPLSQQESRKNRSAAASGSGESSLPRAQFDGGQDDLIEEDEDAINSELDDPEDDQENEDVDDQGLGHIMLCMYDKVARVKNKWKCVLKDGVLTVNNKEYIFHKATGEFEW